MEVLVVGLFLITSEEGQAVIEAEWQHYELLLMERRQDEGRSTGAIDSCPNRGDRNPGGADQDAS